MEGWSWVSDWTLLLPGLGLFDPSVARGGRLTLSVVNTTKVPLLSLSDQSLKFFLPKKVEEDVCQMTFHRWVGMLVTLGMCRYILYLKCIW